MCEEVSILKEIDEENKIIYFEKQVFALGSKEAIEAKRKYLEIVNKAKKLGFSIQVVESTLGSRS